MTSGSPTGSTSWHAGSMSCSSANQRAAPDAEREELRQIQVRLDQWWDLLRQRRARREFGQDPEDAQLRDEKTVEGYTG